MLKNITDIFSKKKSTLTLSKALELKEIIQDNLKRNYGILKEENCVPLGQKRNYDLKKIVKETNTLQEKIVPLKLVIQKANLQILENEKYSVSNNVYLLSEKKATILSLLAVHKKAIAGTTKDDTGKTIKNDTPIYARPELEDWINKLKVECRVIEKKLTILNDSIIVELPFKTDLV